MSNVENIKPLSIREQAEKEVREERSTKAKAAMKDKLRALQNAKGIVANLEREISDLEASIEDGSFV